ncbi:MAG: hypothetical protein IJE43_21320 [Alphaproteobacteria bacterium]|nr:hypothetical protein [Alphaproteobacteria bacterium]
MKEKQKVKYYSFKASTFWTIIIVCVLLALWFLFIGCDEEKDVKSVSGQVVHGAIISQLKNDDECYLCGHTDESLMDYYRKFDTIGVIGLNQWVIIDLRLKEYDSEGNYVKKGGNSSVHSSMQGVDYKIDSTPSRGKTSATIKSTDGMFDETMVKEHLCQTCLDKVVSTMERYTVDEEKAFLPFCVVDFKTLDLYLVQQAEHSYYVRDYLVQVENVNNEIELEAFYLPEQ